MTRRPGAALASGSLLLSAVALAACSSSPGTPQSGPPSTTAIAGNPSAPGWSAAIHLAPGAALSTVSCPTANFCMAGDITGHTYTLVDDRPKALGPAVPSPQPQGSAYLSCTGATFCVAVPSENQGAVFNGSAWLPPMTIAGARGFTAIGCAGAFCATIDGEGNSFIYDGQRWSHNVGAYGAANQISCPSPAFCIAAEGGPSVWNGHSWSEPTNADPQGQLNAVSCANASFCVAVDSGGNVLTWDGAGFGAPIPIATEPPLSGTNASGLTGVSCPAASLCVAVDSIGRAFVMHGTTWTTGTLIDNGHALTAVSCASIFSCVAVDRAGNAFVLGTAKV